MTQINFIIQTCLHMVSGGGGDTVNQFGVFSKIKIFRKTHTSACRGDTMNSTRGTATVDGCRVTSVDSVHPSSLSSSSSSSHGRLTFRSSIDILQGCLSTITRVTDKKPKINFN